jgi:dipeptidyl aminopeptidase/acylaminoacyl peptidase
MRFLWAVFAAGCAWAQQQPFTLEQVLGASFPSSLAASPTGGKVAWVSNVRGVRNILAAAPPDYQARAVTAYTTDDGQEIDDLQWMPDGASIVYTRGGGANRAGEYPNPALDPLGAEQALWIVTLDGAAPRRIGEGNLPAVSPRGDWVLFLRHGQLWWVPADGKAQPSQIFKARGACQRPVWSPDGKRIAFESARGDHAFIGVYDIASATLRYLDPGTDIDQFPAWSPDSRSVAFIRTPSSGLRPVREAQRSGEPWSIRVASAETGEGREVWRASPGSGSVFRGVAGDRQLWWAAGGRLVFPWEAGGWTHLYSVPTAAAAAPPTPLTPGEFEVEHAALAPGGGEMIFSSNQGDPGRRHLWKVPVAGGPPVALTSGTGIEVWPTPTSDPGAVAFLQSGARTPLQVAIRAGVETRYPDPRAIPADFPLKSLVEPQPVVFPAVDGLLIHGQLFLPAAAAESPAGAKSPASAQSPAPAVVFFHGGPQRQMLLGWHSMYYYWNAYAMNQYLAARGYLVLSVNFRGGIGYGLNFREAIGAGPAGASELNDIRGAALYLRSRADVDPARISAWGGSYGGYLTAMALARSPELFRGGVDFHGVHDWARELGIPATEPDYKLAFESSPMADLSGWKSPALLIQGDDDRNVQFSQTVMLSDALRRRHVPVELLVLPDETHDFLLYRSWLAAYQATARFLDRM